MRQIYITGYGGPEKLQLREAPDPQPQGNELRIRVKASGINFADILARQGLYPDAPKAPCVVGYEVSGSVDAAGPAARQDWIGRDAFALTRFGGYADTVVVPETPGIRQACFAQSRAVRGDSGELSDRVAAARGDGLVVARRNCPHPQRRRRRWPRRHRCRAPRRCEDLRHRERRQARLPQRARPERSDRLSRQGLGDGTVTPDRRTRRGTHHRSHWRQPLEKELQGPAIHRDAWAYSVFPRRPTQASWHRSSCSEPRSACRSFTRCPS